MTTPARAARLRHALVDELRAAGAVRSTAVETALRAVPRHAFLPAVPLEQAYADEVVPTKRDADGRAVSAASQPAIVALMLEQAAVRPGERVLEIGTGTGWNAALLAHLAGPSGAVDPDLVAPARAALAAAGFAFPSGVTSHGRRARPPGFFSGDVPRGRRARPAGAPVRVLLGDGATGVPDGAPYDVLVATAGAWDLPAAWFAQLAPAGRLIVPHRLRGGVARSIVYRRAGDVWRGSGGEPCGFMPLREGAADDPRGAVPLNQARTAWLETHQEQHVDAAALAGVRDGPATTLPTGVPFAPAESPEPLWLWLACTMEGGLSRLLTADAVTMATTDGGALAALSPRAGELRVTAWGPSGPALAARVAAASRTWHERYRGAAVTFTVEPPGAAPAGTDGFVFDLPSSRLRIAWDGR